MNLTKLTGSLINKSQKLRGDLRAGRISIEIYKCHIAGILTNYKLGNLMLKSSKDEYRNKELPDLNELPDGEIEMIKCPGMDNKLIARAECLDYSGESRFNECTCEIGIETKKLLLPEN